MTFFPFIRWPGYYVDPVRSAVTKKQLNTTSVQTIGEYARLDSLHFLVMLTE